MHPISIMSFKQGHVSIPKRRFFSPQFLFCTYDNPVLQNLKILTHLLLDFSHITLLNSSAIEYNYFKDRAWKVRKTFPDFSIFYTSFSCPIIPLDIINGVMLLLPVLYTRCRVGSVVAAGPPVTILIYKYKIKKQLMQRLFSQFDTGSIINLKYISHTCKINMIIFKIDETKLILVT